MGRSRKSKRKLNSIYMMLLLTTALMVVSTYAWFSSNREVHINGITAKVAAAEGLQISIDGVKWGSSVDVDEDTLAGINEDAEATINAYAWAEELEPVSADGTISNGKLNFYYGDISPDGATLSGIEQAADSDGKYIVFDIFLKNSSSNNAGDKLQLATGTSIAINSTEGKDNTGLENCVRAGILLYDDTAQFTAALGSTSQILDASENRTIAGLQPGTTPLAAFWEPNYNAHITEVVENDARISAANSVFPTLAMNGASASKNIEGVNGDDVDDGVSVDAEGDPVVADANAGPFMTIPNTITTGSSVSSADIDLTDTTQSRTQLMLAKNSIMKAKVYIWLEGQDPDCIDTASTGRAFDIQLNLCKPAKQQGSASPTATATTDPGQGGGGG